MNDPDEMVDLKGARLLSRTSFALFDEPELVRQFIDNAIGASEV